MSDTKVGREKYLKMPKKGYDAEIIKLSERLKEANIPHKVVRVYDGWMVAYPDIGAKNEVCDFVCHSNSLGHEHNLLESWGVHREIEGNIDASSAFTLIKYIHENRANGKNPIWLGETWAESYSKSQTKAHTKLY